MIDIQAIKQRQIERRSYADTTQVEIAHEELTPQTADDIDALISEVQWLRKVCDDLAETNCE